ncbi:MAG: hypothetical protein ACR2GG_04165 [Gemmatimonadaceae bacterium]
MGFEELMPLVLAIPTTIAGADSAAEAWTVLQSQADPYGVIDPEILAVNIDAEVDLVARQLQAIFDRTPAPEGLRLLYFGLFAAADGKTGAEQAGYHVSGSTRDMPPIETAADLAGPVLDYRPALPYIFSELLQRIKAAALSSHDMYDFYDYAMMLGAAALLSRFALRRLGVVNRLVVGFDSGDVFEI